MGLRGYCLILAATLISLVPRVVELAREGRSPDEELTVLAVDGIVSVGIPRLPAGTFYDRGLLYSYAAWATGRVLGDGLPSYRVPSLIGGACVVALTAFLALRMGASALFGALLAAGATWLIVASSWARFYSLFAASCLLTTLVFLAPSVPVRTRHLAFLAGLVMARLLHELGLALIALPLFMLLQDRSATSRRPLFILLVESIVVLGSLQVLLYVLQGSPDRAFAAAMVDTSLLTRWLPVFWPSVTWLSLSLVAAGALCVSALLWRFGLEWPLCLAAAVFMATLNVGVLLAMGLAFALARPARAVTTVACTLLACAASLVLWTIQLLVTTSALLSLDVVRSMATTSAAVPWNAGTYLWNHWPLLVFLAVVGLLLSFQRTEARAVAFLVLSFVWLLGVLELGLRGRYFIPVFPLLFALAALVPASVAAASKVGWSRRAMTAGVASLLLVALLGEHEQGARDSSLLERNGPFGTSRLRSVPSAEWRAILASLPPEATLVCSDDVACQMGRGRVGYWLLDSEVEARIYGAPAAQGFRSTYTGAPIIAGTRELRSIVDSGRLDGAWLVMLDSLKYGFDEGEILESPSLHFVCEGEGIRLWRVGRWPEDKSPNAREAGRCVVAPGV